MLMSMTTLPISGVSFLVCGLARICLPQRGDSFLDRLLKARECVWQAGPMLVAKLGARESSLDHCHEGLAVRSAQVPAAAQRSSSRWCRTRHGAARAEGRPHGARSTC